MEAIEPIVFLSLDIVSINKFFCTLFILDFSFDFIILLFRDVRMTVIFIILFRMNVLYNILFGDVRKYAGCEQYGLTYTFIII